MGLSNEDLEVHSSDWGLPNMVILVEDHCLGLGLWGNGCSKTSVQLQVVLCCPHLCVKVDCGMILDMLECDFPIVGE